MKEPKLDVSREAVKGLLIDAYNNYEKSFQDRSVNQFYWDGYIRALHHVLEMEGQ